MTTFISFIIVLGILIFIHELGHFMVAKFSGVGVEKFSLGFGPKLIGIKRGETEYRISLLPLGGYVKMVGEAPGEEVSDIDRKKSFTHKPVRYRAAIVAAGPVMNLLLAAILLPVIFMIGVQVPSYLGNKAEVGFVVPDEPASRAGIQSGDVIVGADNKPVKNWQELLEEMAERPKEPLKLKLARNDAVIETTIVPEPTAETGAGYGGMYPPMKPVIGDVSSGYPAKDAGIQPGDVILAVNDKMITHWAELEDIIHKSGEKKTILIGRENQTLTFEVTPKHNKDANIYLIGISRKDEQVLRRYGFIEATAKGFTTSVEMTERLLAVIKGLVLGKYSLKTLGGPIMIAQVAGKAAESGISDLLSLVAFLSLQLGIINLFPIPVLDGGHILFFCIEAVNGKPLSEKFMAIAQQIGIALLIALMVMVTYNDLFRIFG
ncbi:MAG: RIP metalloprotease RseP [Deltaproteobacteria bacterium]|nr:RIP metalloprotease RseP [Deltaproteobacteria bacterium]